MLKNLVCSILIGLITAQAALAEGYSASYKAHYKDVEGEAKYTISQDSDGHYSVELSIVPDNFLLKLTVGDLVDKVSGQFKGGHFYPESYQRKTDGEVTLNVDFIDNIAYVFDSKGKRQFPVSQLGQDPLSQIAQVQFDMGNRRLQPSYYLVTNKNQRRYDAIREGDKVVLSEYPSRKRQLTLWFDTYATRLLKMQKNKGPKKSFFMEKIK